MRGTINGLDPAVSPDGRELAFVQLSDVKVLAFEGGPIRTLTQAIWPRWGPDGHIYATVPTGTVRVPVTGGPPDTLTRLTGDEASHWIMDFLPGGSTALLEVDLPGGVAEARALDLTTGEMKPLGFGFEPRYADSGHLVTLVDGTLMAAPFDPKAVEVLGPAVALVDGVGTYGMSRTGNLLSATGGAGGDIDDTELVWVTRSGMATPVQEGWAFDRGPGGNFGWSLSLDGTRVALRRETAGNQDVWVKDLPEGPLRRLTFDEAEQREPWWSPDGQTVMFSCCVLGDRNVWSRPADGTGSGTLVHDDERSLAQGRWSPVGEWLVFRSAAVAPDEGQRDIMGFRPGVDSAAISLVATEYQEHAPAVSPDGRWLAYSSDETGRHEVFVRPFPDVESGKQQVSLEGGIAPRWAYSGRELFYLNPGSVELVAVSIETEPDFRVLSQEALFSVPEGTLLSPSVNFYDVAPGDERFLMGRAFQAGGAEGSGGPSLVLVQNFFEELKARVVR